MSTSSMVNLLLEELLCFYVAWASDFKIYLKAFIGENELNWQWAGCGFCILLYWVVPVVNRIYWSKAMKLPKLPVLNNISACSYFNVRYMVQLVYSYCLKALNGLPVWSILIDSSFFPWHHYCNRLPRKYEQLLCIFFLCFILKL